MDALKPAALVIETHFEIHVRDDRGWGPSYDYTQVPREAVELATAKARFLDAPIVLIDGTQNAKDIVNQRAVVIQEIWRNRSAPGWPRIFQRHWQMPKLAALLGEFPPDVTVLSLAELATRERVA